MGITFSSLLFSAIVVAGVLPVKAQICYETKGNICLKQCGVFTDGGLDLAAPYFNGPYIATAIYPECTPECHGHAIGVDYFSGEHCVQYDGAVKASRIAVLVQTVPGAAIFGTSCSGRLVQLNLPQRTVVTTPVMSRRKTTDSGQDDIGMER